MEESLVKATLKRPICLANMHICHLTLLNPALHTRIFYKLALSQHKLGYQVSIIGKDTALSPYTTDNIQIIPIPQLKRRFSPKRLRLAIQVLRKALQVRADVYTLHTPELIWVGHFLKRSGKKIIYDVHEDYGLNIRASHHYPAFIRKLLSTWVRGMEKRAARRFEAVVYSEYCYDNILAVPNEKKFFLPNKYTPQSFPEDPSYEIPDTPYMLYTGTLAPAWGILETLELWRQFNTLQPLWLVIAGHTRDKRFVDLIQEKVDQYKLQHRFILVGGTSYVPYPHIVQLIQSCWFGTGLYHPLPHIVGKIPTKFYEYMAFDKPLVYTREPFWDQFNAQEQLGFSYVAGDDLQLLQSQLSTWKGQHLPHQYAWETEESTLMKLMKQVERNLSA